ncbi:c-type cytochrome [Rhabdothermincola sediminis]|uniref:c-type cytochrome n=1 Tax=Rhabdothermincola sediminis TaxID=2751370 RepID=UPI001AA0288C|nr:cytochrome c [Rhabdothermincola sediminis]
MKAVKVLTLAVALVVGVLALNACGTGSDDTATPADPVLARGQQVFRQNCATCHGAKGGGGNGPRLAGVVASRYPNIEDQIAVITEGRAGMPSFGQQLSAEDIRAVATYERSL